MSEKRQRGKLLSVRFNEAEWQSLNARADSAGLSLGGYLRSVVLETPPPRQSRRPPVVVQELAQLMGQIGKIGSNINQLARIANMGGWPEAALLEQAAADISWMRERLFAAFNFRPRPAEREP